MTFDTTGWVAFKCPTCGAVTTIPPAVASGVLPIVCHVPACAGAKLVRQ